MVIYVKNAWAGVKLQNLWDYKFSNVCVCVLHILSTPQGLKPQVYTIPLVNLSFETFFLYMSLDLARVEIF